MKYIGKLEFDKELKNSNNKIIIFGAGTLLKKMIEELVNNNLSERILCICDNNYHSCNKVFEDIEICSPEYVFKYYPDAIFIVYNRFCIEICEQLMKEGIKRIHLIIL